MLLLRNSGNLNRPGRELPLGGGHAPTQRFAGLQRFPSHRESTAGGRRRPPSRRPDAPAGHFLTTHSFHSFITAQNTFKPGGCWDEQVCPLSEQVLFSTPAAAPRHEAASHACSSSHWPWNRWPCRVRPNASFRAPRYFLIVFSNHVTIVSHAGLETGDGRTKNKHEVAHPALEG